MFEFLFSTRRIAAAAFTMLLLSALIAAACSGDDDKSPTASAAPAADAGETQATEPAEADPPPSSGDTIRLGFSAWPGWFPWQVTVEQGIFEDVGVDVEMVWFDGYLDSINAFAAGQLDGNSQTLNDTLASVAVGDDQVIVIVNDNSTGNDQIIVRDDIQTIEDLAGKRIGIEVGVVDHFLLLLGLDSVGLSESDVEVVNLLTDAAAASFSTGQLDAVGVFAPFTTQALELEGSHALFTSADFPGSIPDHLAVSRELVEERPDDVQKIVEAWYRTLDFIAAHPDEAVAIMAERAGVSVEDYNSYDAGTTLFTADQALATYQPGDDFGSLQFAAEAIADFLVASDFVPQRPVLDGVFDSRFTETYLATAAAAGN